MSQDENQVSKTSGSRVSSALPQVAQADGSASSPGSGTVT